MANRLALAVLCGIFIASAAVCDSSGSDEATPTIVAPQRLHWSPTPIRGISGATIVGDPSRNGLYVVYARYGAGVRSPPHTHPDTRIVTVVSGTFYAGAGNEFDAARTKALTAGMTLIVPAKSPHFGWAKDGPVILQEVGTGPTRIDLLQPRR